jgi:predicted Zn-dependent protease
MLFDLRGRGRRRTVQATYLGLALLMLSGLVLFGVGTGVGGGGLLNAFNGGSSNQKQVVSQQEKTALRETRLRPTNPAAWGDLIQARWTNAQQGSNFDPATGTVTASGKQELARLTQAWQHYLTLTKSPDPNLAILAARSYGQLGDYASQATAWDVQTLANPSEVKGYECLAMASYAAKQNRKGDLALAKAMSLAPKASRAVIKQQIVQAKTNPQVAQAC